MKQRQPAKDFNELFNQQLELSKEINFPDRNTFLAWLRSRKETHADYYNFLDEAGYMIKHLQFMYGTLDAVIEDIKAEHRQSQFNVRETPNLGPYSKEKFMELVLCSESTVNRWIKEQVITPLKNAKGHYVFTQEHLATIYTAFPERNPANNTTETHSALLPRLKR